MPHSPLSKLRPGEFPKIGDEEDAFDSCDEDTDAEPEPEHAEGDSPSENEENENEEATLLPKESRNVCRIN